MSDLTAVLRAALDSLKDPLFVLDAARQCVFANSAFRSFLGFSQGADCRTRDFWPDAESWDLNRSEFACELHVPDGTVFGVKLAVSPIPPNLHLIRVLAGSARNEALKSFHSQRLETLGMLAGGVAHDFNNVLAGILGHVTYLKTILPGRGPHVESLLSIEEGAKKATSITQQILNFSRLEVTEKSVAVNLCDLVARTCHLLRGAISPEIRVEHQAPAYPISVLGAEGRLAQVIVNLVVNSRDAVKTGGLIRVAVEIMLDKQRLRRMLNTDDLPFERYAMLSVVDDGHGMSRDVLDRIFEPYFSTKHEKGTGLGLSTVASIIRQYGGAIEVTSELNVGTEVRVYLPSVNAPEPKSAPREHERKLERGTEKILVVDDEYPVRNVLCVSLQHLGYQVETASSGAEAIERFKDGSNRFDLVILDMLMPNLSGEKVFFRLRQLDEGVRVLLISGFASEEAVKNVLDNGGLDFIQKPFTIEELSRRVRACLDAT